MTALRWSAMLAAALALLLAAVLVVAYLRAMGQAYERIAGRSEVVASPLGTIEFAQGGAGPAVLVVHGSGGGFDQGELIAQAVLGEGFRWIAPSRFGYLRSTFRDGATFADQAEAYRHLLDHLGIARVAVVALSHGGPSALLFAALHPERVSSLVLISCGVASAPADPGQAQANRKGDALVTIFSHDPLYWAFSTVLKKQLVGLMGADNAVLSDLAPPQRQLADDVIAFMNPVVPRAAGVALDNRAELPNGRIAAIRAPTLILHAADDGLQRYHNAEFAAATIPHARLVRFEHGGHLLMAVEQASVREQVQSFILASAGG